MGCDKSGHLFTLVCSVGCDFEAFEDDDHSMDICNKSGCYFGFG